ncbi:unnamed protein product, partial [Urochloa humidicola]
LILGLKLYLPHPSSSPLPQIPAGRSWRRRPFPFHPIAPDPSSLPSPLPSVRPSLAVVRSSGGARGGGGGQPGKGWRQPGGGMRCATGCSAVESDVAAGCAAVVISVAAVGCSPMAVHGPLLVCHHPSVPSLSLSWEVVQIVENRQRARDPAISGYGLRRRARMRGLRRWTRQLIKNFDNVAFVLVCSISWKF